MQSSSSSKPLLDILPWRVVKIAVRFTPHVYFQRSTAAARKQQNGACCVDRIQIPLKLYLYSVSQRRSYPTNIYAPRSCQKKGCPFAFYVLKIPTVINFVTSQHICGRAAHRQSPAAVVPPIYSTAASCSSRIIPYLFLRRSDSLLSTSRLGCFCSAIAIRQSDITRVKHRPP